MTQHAFQVTALVFPFPDSPIRPYGLVGAGWYYTKFEYSGLFSIFEDETDRLFGFHVGAGAELDPGKSAALFGDFRWRIEPVPFRLKRASSIRVLTWATSSSCGRPWIGST